MASRSKLLVKFILILIPASLALLCESIANNSGAETKYWSSKTNPSFSIHYPECWRELKQSRGFEIPDRLSLTPTQDCPKSEQGKWRIDFIAPSSFPPSAVPGEGVQEINVKGISVKFYDRVVDFTEGKNKKKIKYNRWSASFVCSGFLFSADYKDPLNSTELEKISKEYLAPESFRKPREHVVPEVFKKFIGSFNCYYSK